MAEEYYLYKKADKSDKSEKGREPGVLFLFDTGYYTVVSGWGEMFHHYCQTKKLGDYTGRNVIPCNPGDTDYGESRLCILPFDCAFSFIRKNVTDSEYF